MQDIAIALILTILAILSIGGTLAIANLYSRVGTLEFIACKMDKQKKAE